MRVSASGWLQPGTSMVSCLTTPPSSKKCRHSPRWPTYTWRSCMICAYVCSFHSFSRNVGNSVLNDGDLSASLKSTGRVYCVPMIVYFRSHVPLRSLFILLIDGISYVSKIMSTRLLDLDGDCCSEPASGSLPYAAVISKEVPVASIHYACSNRC